jgi:hypothetical protein
MIVPAISGSTNEEGNNVLRHRRQHSWSLWTVLLASLLGTVGCDQPPICKLGDECRWEGDCPREMFCVYRRCRQQCITAADCGGTNYACLPTPNAPHVGVCTLADEYPCQNAPECDPLCNNTLNPDESCLECVRGCKSEKLTCPAGGNNVFRTSCNRGECGLGLTCVDGLCLVCIADGDCQL